jgi:hypothetical protein
MEEGFSTWFVKERTARIMDIAGVTQTAQVLPNTQAQAQPQPPQPQSMDQAQSTTGADMVNFSAQVSTQVMDMAQSQFENAANQLISQMAAATGVGQNVDMSV